MKKNDLIWFDDTLYRVLDIQGHFLLLINCVQRSMPTYHAISGEAMHLIKPASEEDLQNATGFFLEDITKVSVKRKNIAHKRFSLISTIVVSITDRILYTKLLNDVSGSSGISKQTLRQYLCKYLVFQNIACLLPAESNRSKQDLTETERIFRWALNKWFYNQSGHTLQWTYSQMLREKYCDENNELLKQRPTFHQFRYYYRKHRSKQNYLIARNGLGDYQRNDRPLLGDRLQERFPNIGNAMLDGTICDIYLVDDSGSVIGRPVLTACIDAHTSICCGYCLSLESGTYNLRNLLLNTLCDKQEWCKKHNIIIDRKDWPCSSLPGVMITDKGSEYISENFIQVTELGVTLIDLAPFRPDLKPMVEKFFDLVQSYYKNELKGLGVVDKNFGDRTNRTDYRKQACLTIAQFEAVLIRAILYYNSQRTLESYPYTEEMISTSITPTATGVWNFKKKDLGTNLITVDSQRLSLVLLPRTKGKFGRNGLRANGLRYVHCTGNYTDRYLEGDEVTVAFSPDNVSRVWLVENGSFYEFRLIESRFKDMSILSVSELKEKTKVFIKGNEENKLQGQIDLSNHIRNIVAASDRAERVINGIREKRQREIIRNHIEIGGELE